MISKTAYYLIGSWIFIFLHMYLCSNVMSLTFLVITLKEMYKLTSLYDKKLVKKIGIKKIEYWYEKEVDAEFNKFFLSSIYTKEYIDENRNEWRKKFKLEKDTVTSIMYYYKHLIENKRIEEFMKNDSISFRVSTRLYKEEKRDMDIKKLLK